MAHAQIMMQYLQDNDCSVVLEAIDKPIIKIQDFKTPLVESLNHERYVSGLIHTLYAVSYTHLDVYKSQG